MVRFKLSTLFVFHLNEKLIVTNGRKCFTTKTCVPSSFAFGNSPTRFVFQTSQGEYPPVIPLKPTWKCWVISKSNDLVLYALQRYCSGEISIERLQIFLNDGNQLNDAKEVGSALQFGQKGPCHWNMLLGPVIFLIVFLVRLLNLSRGLEPHRRRMQNEFRRETMNSDAQDRSTKRYVQFLFPPIVNTKKKFRATLHVGNQF